MPKSTNESRHITAPGPVSGSKQYKLLNPALCVLTHVLPWIHVLDGVQMIRSPPREGTLLWETGAGTLKLRALGLPTHECTARANVPGQRTQRMNAFADARGDKTRWQCSLFAVYFEHIATYFITWKHDNTQTQNTSTKHKTHTTSTVT